MTEKDYIKLNTVSSENQLKGNRYVTFTYRENAALKVLFVGNSITRHGIREEIGWFWDHGMAASSIDKDYVHRTAAMLEEKYGPVSFCIAQLANWERDYWHSDEVLNESYTDARDFGADIIVIRLGENIRDDDYRVTNVKDYYADMISFLKAKNPAAKIVVTDNFWKRKPIETTGRTINDEFFDVAGENGYTFCSIKDLSDDEKTMAIGLFEHRGVSIHPGDYGMEMIAKRIYAAIEGLLGSEND